MSRSGGAPVARPDAEVVDPEAAERGVLAELIEVEQRVQEEIRAAEAEAARAVAAARAEIDAQEREHDDALDAALRELAARLESERREALDEIARQSDEEVRRFRGVDEARVRALAERVATRVAEGDLEGRASPT
jgi:hypothetical protein